MLWTLASYTRYAVIRYADALLWHCGKERKA